MKKLLYPALFTAALLAFTTACAQSSGKGEYHIKIEKDINGRKEVIEKTFDSRQEMDAFMERMNELPQPPEPPQPPAAPEMVEAPQPPQPPAAPRAPQAPEAPALEGAEGKYHLNVVRIVNGKKEVIDQTFNTKDAMEEYMEANHLEDNIVQTVNIECTKNKEEGKPCKKIVIVTNGAEEDEQEEITEQPAAEKVIIEKRIEKGKGGRQKITVIETHQIKQEKKEENLQSSPKVKEIIIAGPPLQSGNGELQNISEVKVFPNPAQQHFFIEFKILQPADVKIRITDLNGKEVYAETLKGYQGAYRKDIFQPGLATGTYLMEVEAGAEKQVTRVVVQ